MGAAIRQAGLITAIAKPIAEAGLGKRFTEGRHQKRLHADHWSSVNDATELGVYRDGQRHRLADPVLLLRIGEKAVLDVRWAQEHDIRRQPV